MRGLLYDIRRNQSNKDEFLLSLFHSQILNKYR